jgi:hypothetical protein
MTQDLHTWKLLFREKLFDRMKGLQPGEESAAKYSRGFQELQASFSLVVSGTGLKISEAESYLMYVGSDRETKTLKLRYYSVRFGMEDFYIFPVRLFQNRELLRKYPGLIGRASLSISGRIDFMDEYRLYIVESAGQLRWVYRTVDKEDWYQAGNYAVVDTTVMQRMLEENFLNSVKDPF